MPLPASKHGKTQPSGNNRDCGGKPTSRRGIFARLFWAVAIAGTSALIAERPAEALNLSSHPAGFTRVVVGSRQSVGCALALDPLDPQIGSLLAGQLTGGITKDTADRVTKWNPARQRYATAYLSAGLGGAGLTGRWVEETVGGWVASQMTLQPGEAFFIENRQSRQQTVFLTGTLVLDDTWAVPITPGLNLAAYPYSAPIAVNKTLLAAHGAVAGTTRATSDQLTVLSDGSVYWLKKLIGMSKPCTWVNFREDSTIRVLSAGSGFWLKHAGAAAFTWTEPRPYANPYPAEPTEPLIEAVQGLPDEQTVLLRIGAGNMGSARTVSIYYQDVAPGAKPNPADGWIQAQADLPVNGAATVVWKDIPASGERPPVSTTATRLYLVEEGAPISVSPTNSGYLGMSLPADFRAFATSSPWNTPIPSGSPADPDSPVMIATLATAAPTLGGAYRKWTYPMHVIDSTRCPLVSVPTTGDGLYSSVDPDRNGVAEGIPMPAGVWPDPEADGHMVLVDPVVRKSWEFSRASRDALGNWSASIVDVWDLNGNGYRQPFSGSCWWRSGANGAGTPLIGGVIRPEEVAAGVIRHALMCSTPVNRVRASGTTPRWELRSPAASRTDAPFVGRQYIPEGARLQLDPALDLDTLGLAPQARVVACAMQQYGMFVTDNAPSFGIYFQNLGPSGGSWESWDIPGELAKIPVSSFRVLAGTTVVKN